MNVNFYYKDCQKNNDIEHVLTSLVLAVSNVIELPDTIEICIYPLGNGVYGGIDLHKINRIGLNSSLSMKDIPLILIHELIHVHQKFKGILRFKANGESYWYGLYYTKKKPEDMTYEEYNNLPWEVDVRNKQTEVLKKALAFLQQ